MSSPAKNTVTLRPARPEDEPLLLELYAAARAFELAQVPWSDEQKAAFVRMQFAAQTEHYRAHYADASFDVIECDGEAIGRFYVWRGKEAIRIVDIAILPERRSQGLGTPLLQALLDEAAQSGRRVQVYVEVFNPSLRLFERLGFTSVENDGINHLMQWQPRASRE